MHGSKKQERQGVMGLAWAPYLTENGKESQKVGLECQEVL